MKILGASPVNCFTGRSVFREVFGAWAFFFTCFIIPLEFLFRVDAFLNYLPAIHILFNAFLVLWLYTAVAATFASITVLGYVVLKIFNPDRTWCAKAGIQANVAVIVFGLVYKLLTTSVVWFNTVRHRETAAENPTTLVAVVSLFGALAVLWGKPQLAARLLAITQRTLRPILVLLAIAFLMICVHGVTTTVGTRRENTPPKVLKTTETRPNVILITLDALTANDMSLYGYAVPTTPSLKSFSDRSYVFNHAYSSSNFTTPGIASILTAKYPITNKVYNYFNFLSPAIAKENLAHELRQAGYETTAIFANAAGHPNHNNTFRDFDHAPITDCSHRINATSLVNSTILTLEHLGFHPYPWFGERLGAMLPSIESALFCFFPHEREAREQTYAQRPEITLDFARAHLRRASAPYFLWVHLLAPHAPYLPDAAFKHRFLPEKILETATSQKEYSNSYYPPEKQPLIDKLRLRYDEQIAWTDKVVGEFIDDLTRDGTEKKSIIIITSDHGEQFEKGYHEHGGAGCMYLYQPLIHIPLLMHLPGQADNRTISENVTQVDIAPTILDLLKLPVPAWMEGKSLLRGTLEQPQRDTQTIFSMNLERCSPGKTVDDGSIAVIQGDYKYIYYVRSRKSELFDLSQDPHEELNLVSVFPEKAGKMRQLAIHKLGLGD